MIEIIKQAALAGGKVLRKYFQQELEITHKANIHDIVTKADTEAQREIIQSIERLGRSKLGNNIGFIGEEKVYKQAEYMFIIDPLDGTTSFASGIEYFSVSIGLMKGQKLIAGVVYDASRNNMFFAEHGKGAYKNNMKLTIPRGKTLQTAVILTGISPIPTKALRRLKLMQSMIGKVRGIRMLGSNALDIANVAAGVGDIAWAGGSIWDIAAGKLIIEEAGGTFRSWEGLPVELDVRKPDKIYRHVAGELNLVQNFIQLLRKNSDAPR